MDAEQTIVSGIICKTCNETLPDMLMSEHLDINCPKNKMCACFENKMNSQQITQLAIIFKNACDEKHKKSQIATIDDYHVLPLPINKIDDVKVFSRISAIYNKEKKNHLLVFKIETYNSLHTNGTSSDNIELFYIRSDFVEMLTIEFCEKMFQNIYDAIPKLRLNKLKNELTTEKNEMNDLLTVFLKHDNIDCNTCSVCLDICHLIGTFCEHCLCAGCFSNLKSTYIEAYDIEEVNCPICRECIGLGN